MNWIISRLEESQSIVTIRTVDRNSKVENTISHTLSEFIHSNKTQISWTSSTRFISPPSNHTPNYTRRVSQHSLQERRKLQEVKITHTLPRKCRKRRHEHAVMSRESFHGRPASMIQIREKKGFSVSPLTQSTFVRSGSSWYPMMSKIKSGFASEDWAS